MTFTQVPQQRKLDDVLNRARAAIAEQQARSGTSTPITVRPTEPPQPAIKPNPAPVPTALPRPSCVPLETLTDLDALRPGPRRLLELLHQVAVATVTARAYPVVPSQVTIHQPQELVARALGCSLKSVYNWTGVLVAAGLVASQAHYTTSQGVTRVDGTLYAVALKAKHVAHLAYEDLVHEWRDLDGDRLAGHTAHKALTGSAQRERGEWYQILKAWAVIPGSIDNFSLFTDPVNQPESLQDVAHALPLLASAHPSKRPALVSMLASTLARTLNDPHSRRWYCRVIWDAWRAEMEGRGGLQVLGAQLDRLDAVRQEWAALKRPAALLTSRLRPA